MKKQQRMRFLAELPEICRKLQQAAASNAGADLTQARIRG